MESYSYTLFLASTLFLLLSTFNYNFISKWQWNKQIYEHTLVVKDLRIFLMKKRQN